MVCKYCPYRKVFGYFPQKYEHFKCLIYDLPEFNIDALYDANCNSTEDELDIIAAQLGIEWMKLDDPDDCYDQYDDHLYDDNQY